MSNEADYPKLAELNAMCAEIRGLRAANEARRDQIGTLKRIRQNEQPLRPMFVMNSEHGAPLHYHQGLSKRFYQIAQSLQNDVLRQMEMELDAEIRANITKIKIKDAAIRAALRGEE